MTTVIDLAALPPTGIVVPGIAAWLGIDQQPASDEPVESYEAYLERISREAA